MDSLVLDSPVGVAERGVARRPAALLRPGGGRAARPGLARPAVPAVRDRRHADPGPHARRDRAALRRARPSGCATVPGARSARTCSPGLSSASSAGGNAEFAAQVAASREAIAALLQGPEGADPPADPWLASEQALVFGHPFHPSPKARGGRRRLAAVRAGGARPVPAAAARRPRRPRSPRRATPRVLDRLGARARRVHPAARAPVAARRCSPPSWPRRCATAGCSTWATAPGTVDPHLLGPHRVRPGRPGAA